MRLQEFLTETSTVQAKNLVELWWCTCLDYENTLIELLILFNQELFAHFTKVVNLITFFRK